MLSACPLSFNSVNKARENTDIIFMLRNNKRNSYWDIPLIYNLNFLMENKRILIGEVYSITSFSINKKGAKYCYA